MERRKTQPRNTTNFVGKECLNRHSTGAQALATKPSGLGAGALATVVNNISLRWSSAAPASSAPKTSKSEFWKDLRGWASHLRKTARLDLDGARNRVELCNVSYESRRQLGMLASRAGVGHPLAFLYLQLRNKAVTAKALNGSLPYYFHVLTDDRTSYRGSLKMESASLRFFVQPLGDALQDYCTEFAGADIDLTTKQSMESPLHGLTITPRKRGRPPLPPERKHRAWQAKQAGQTNRAVASILYKTPAEGQTVSGMLELRRRVIETVDLNQRVQVLEEKHKANESDSQQRMQIRS